MKMYIHNRVVQWWDNVCARNSSDRWTFNIQWTRELLTRHCLSVQAPLPQSKENMHVTLCWRFRQQEMLTSFWLNVGPPSWDGGPTVNQNRFKLVCAARSTNIDTDFKWFELQREVTTSQAWAEAAWGYNYWVRHCSYWLRPCCSPRQSPWSSYCTCSCCSCSWRRPGWSWPRSRSSYRTWRRDSLGWVVRTYCSWWGRWGSYPCNPRSSCIPAGTPPASPSRLPSSCPRAGKACRPSPTRARPLALVRAAASALGLSPAGISSVCSGGSGTRSWSAQERVLI